MGNLLKKIAATQGGLFLSFLRIFIGLIFLKAGVGKLFGTIEIFGMRFEGQEFQNVVNFFTSMNLPLFSPTVHVYLAAYTEFFGGILLILGFGTRLVALPLAFTMFVAVTKAHHILETPLPEWDTHIYYVLVLLFSCLVLVEKGAGLLSLDKIFAWSKPKQPLAPSSTLNP